MTVRTASKLLAALLTISVGAGVARSALADTATSAKKKKDKKKDAAASPAQPPPEQKSNILSTKSAVKETKVRQGPASYKENEAKLQERDAKADQKRDEEIEELEKLIPTQTGSTKADLLFQLAELWWEKSKYVYFTEMSKYEQDEQKFYEDQGKGVKGLKEPKQNNRKSDLYRQQAIDLYNKILTDYPQYPRKDEVLFNLAYNMYDLGKKKDAVSRYWELIRQYPNSKFVPDSYIQLAEHFFNSNDLQRARTAYQKALEFNIPQIYAFALYKLAWCDYNAGAYDESLGKFRKVVDYQEKAIDAGAKNEKKDKIQLKNEALSDMVLGFAKLNQVTEAKDYYEQHASKKKTYHLMGRLASVYFDSGGWDSAIKTYRMILADEPTDPDAPAFQANVVKAFANQGPGQRNHVRDELKKLVDTYKPASDWANANAKSKAALASAYDLSEGSMRELVTEYHSEAQRTKSVATYRLARDIYKEYLADFPTSENSYSLRFYYAEILWALEQWPEAAEQYELVAHKDAKGAYAKTATYDALLCYEKLVAIDEGKLAQHELSDNEKIDEKKGKGGIDKTTKRLETAKTNTQETPLTKWEEKLVAASDNYVKAYPAGADESNLLYKSATIYYDHYHYVEAARRFGEVIQKFPADKNAGYAANLTLHALEVKEEWEALNRLARLFSKNKLLVKGEFGKDLPKIIEGSQFKYDMLVYEKKDYDKSAQLFAEFVKEFPKSQYAPKALFNSLVMFENAKKLDKAIPVGEKLVADYPQSELVLRVVGALGRDYEQTADFAKAAAEYEKYANKDPKDAKASDYLFNAALWNEGLGNFDKAIALYQQYIKTYKDKKDVPDIALTVCLIQEKQKDWKTAVKSFDNYVKTYQKDLTGGQVYYARDRQMEDYRKTGNAADEKLAVKIGDDLLKSYPKLSDADKKKDSNLNAYGQLRFHELDPLWAKYKAIKFDNAARLKGARDLKLKTLPELEKKYTEVVAIGSGDWGVAAVTRIGFAYLDFAKNFTDSPDPKNLPPDLLDQYRAELENFALPLEDKGIEGIEKGLQKSSELLVYNDYVLQAQDQENKYRPGTFGDIHSLPFQGSEFFATAPLEATAGEAAGSSAKPETDEGSKTDDQSQSDDQKAPDEGKSPPAAAAKPADGASKSAPAAKPVDGTTKAAPAAKPAAAPTPAPAAPDKTDDTGAGE